MPRPKAYDEDHVLDAAMRVFWRKGYVATSMADIYAATGLKPGNLYATFTDKETLFRRAFDAYAAHFRASLPKGLTGRGAIAAWIDTQAALAIDDPERKGCLIVNTVTEREAHAPQTRALAQDRLAEITDFFRHAHAEAREAGEIAPDRDADRDAAALTGAVVAIMTLGRAGAEAGMIRAVADSAKGTLG
jgi:TetR/AcrR family transcriptional regulator, transcriptional repressor for nem operon